MGRRHLGFVCGLLCRDSQTLCRSQQGVGAEAPPAGHVLWNWGRKDAGRRNLRAEGCGRRAALESGKLGVPGQSEAPSLLMRDTRAPSSMRSHLPRMPLRPSLSAGESARRLGPGSLLLVPVSVPQSLAVPFTLVFLYLLPALLSFPLSPPRLSLAFSFFPALSLSLALPGIPPSLSP